MPKNGNFEDWLAKYPWHYRGMYEKSLVLLGSAYRHTHPKTYELIVGLLALAFKAGQSQYWRYQRQLQDELDESSGDGKQSETGVK